MPTVFDAYMRARKIDTDLFLARGKKRGGAEALASARHIGGGVVPAAGKEAGKWRGKGEAGEKAVHSAASSDERTGRKSPGVIATFFFRAKSRTAT